MGKDFRASLFFLEYASLIEKRCFVFDPRNRKKTIDFMIEEGLTEDDVFDIVTKLQPQHYEWGAEADDNGTEGDIWQFFYPYIRKRPKRKKIEIYIKLKIKRNLGDGVCIVISFHERGQHGK